MIKFDSTKHIAVSNKVGPDKVTVSTVHIGGIPFGLDYDYETMVFASNAETGECDFSELDSDRYTTITQAKEGHRVMVSRWEKRLANSRTPLLESGDSNG